jgi:hypothetical protein
MSNAKLALLAISMEVINILGKEAYIVASGLHGHCLIKNLTPSWAFLVRKRARAIRK